MGAPESTSVTTTASVARGGGAGGLGGVGGFGGVGGLGGFGLKTDEKSCEKILPMRSPFIKWRHASFCKYLYATKHTLL